MTGMVYAGHSSRTGYFLSAAFLGDGSVGLILNLRRCLLGQAGTGSGGCQRDKDKVDSVKYRTTRKEVLK